MPDQSGRVPPSCDFENQNGCDLFLGHDGPHDPPGRVQSSLPPHDHPWPMGCDAIEATFVFGAQRCMRRATGVVSCSDCNDRTPGHVHPVCPEHGGPEDA